MTAHVAAVGSDRYAAAVRLERRHVDSQPQIKSLRAQIGVQHFCHIAVERRHDVRAALQQRYRNASPHKVFRRFQPYESAAGYNGLFRVRFSREVVYRERVLDGTERERPVAARSGNGRHRRFRPGREQQLVVTFLILAPAVQFPDLYGFSLRIDVRDLAPHAHVDIETPPETFRRLQRERAPVRDDAADIIGQSAVCVRDISRALENYYLRIFVVSSETRRGGRAACHASDNDYFHDFASVDIL